MKPGKLGGLTPEDLSPGAEGWESEMRMLAGLGSLSDPSLESFPTSFLVVAVHP